MEYWAISTLTFDWIRSALRCLYELNPEPINHPTGGPVKQALFSAACFWLALAQIARGFD